MLTIVTAAQMAAMDQFSIKEMKIPGVVLMENAGLQVFRYIYRHFQHHLKNKRILVLCGAGNNGGDGFVIARHLHNHGAHVDVFLLTPEEKIAGDARINLDILKQIQCPVKVVSDIPENIPVPDLIVDAMLGTGVKGAPRGLFAGFTEWANAQNCPVVAVDLPTGVNADTGAVEGPAIEADATLTFALPKRGLLFYPGRKHAGDLQVVDISMPRQAIEEEDSGVYLLQAQDIRRMLPDRPGDAYKNSCGMAAVIAGSRGLTGAACLTSSAIMNAGAGLCYLAAPRSLDVIYESRLLEVVLWPMEDQNEGRLTIEHAPGLLAKTGKMTAIAIGPGLGSAKATGQLVKQLLKDLDKPLVLDADGLNLVADETHLLASFQNEIVLTPHPGEFSRLTGLSTGDIAANRIELVKDFCMKWGAVIVLKGAPTVIGTPSGKVYINPTGNAGMATAGSGDVLTGIITGLLAQGLSAEQAALTGVFVHGVSGDLARDDNGTMGMVAGHILENIAPALNKIMNGEI